MSKKDSSTLFPKTILVYARDYVDGEPVYAVAEAADDIPEDYDDTPVVVYHAHCSGDGDPARVWRPGWRQRLGRAHCSGVLSVVKTVEGI